MLSFSVVLKVFILAYIFIKNKFNLAYIVYFFDERGSDEPPPAPLDTPLDVDRGTLNSCSTRRGLKFMNLVFLVFIFPI